MSATGFRTTGVTRTEGEIMTVYEFDPAKNAWVIVSSTRVTPYGSLIVKYH
jgi:N-acetylneuraminic acid mutarotase